MLESRLEDGSALGVPQCLIACSFRVRHHAKNVFIFIANPCNVFKGTIGIGLSGNFPVLVAVPENDLAFHAHILKCGFGGIVFSLTMRHRYF